MFHRERPEKEYECVVLASSPRSFSHLHQPHLQKLWNRDHRLLRSRSRALNRKGNCSGTRVAKSFIIETGFSQYNEGIPKNSRFAANHSFLNKTVKELQTPQGQEKIRKVRELTALAQGTYARITSLAKCVN
jgi:hypothetical protein